MQRFLQPSLIFLDKMSNAPFINWTNASVRAFANADPLAAIEKVAVRLLFEQETDEKADEVFGYLLLSSSCLREQFSSAETQGHNV